MKYGENFQAKFRVIIALSHDMGEFISDRVYGEKEAEELVMKLRADELNCYAKFDHWLEPGFTPRKHYRNAP